MIAEQYYAHRELNATGIILPTEGNRPCVLTSESKTSGQVIRPGHWLLFRGSTPNIKCRTVHSRLREFCHPVNGLKNGAMGMCVLIAPSVYLCRRESSFRDCIVAAGL